jgi:hypothetical protein
MSAETKRLVNAGRLLLELFEEECRPSIRWLREQQKRKVIPYIKVGHLVFFDTDDVREALSKRRTVKARGT